MKLIVSREARVQVAKHAWHRCNRRVYGAILGFRFTILAALPFSSVKTWEESDRTACEAALLAPARQLAKQLHLQVIGWYASSDADFHDEKACPLRNEGIFIDYYLMCCPGHSWVSYFSNGRIIAHDRVAVSPGKRLTSTINQRKIIAHWNRLLGRNCYLDEQRP